MSESNSRLVKILIFDVEVIVLDEDACVFRRNGRLVLICELKKNIYKKRESETE